MSEPVQFEETAAGRRVVGVGAPRDGMNVMARRAGEDEFRRGHVRMGKVYELKYVPTDEVLFPVDEIAEWRGLNGFDW